MPIAGNNRESVEIDAFVFQPRRNARRERATEIDRIDHVEGLLVLHDRRVNFGVMSSTSAASNRLESCCPHAASPQLGQQRRRDVRFADAGVGPGDEKSCVHVFFSDLHAPATARTARKGVIGTRYRL